MASNSTKRLSIGIDLGGTNIKYALVAEGGEIRWSAECPTQADQPRDQLIERLATCIRECQQEAGDMKVQAVGIGTSGLVNIETGVVLGGAPNLPDWHDLPLGQMLKDRTSLPIYVDNDANLMGLGEYVFGLNKEGQNMLMLTIGTGIGGAIIINGALYRGANYAGAELGCLPWTLEEKSGYWEDFASTSALVRNYRNAVEINPANANGRLIVEKYQQRDPIAMEVMQAHFSILGQGIGGLVNIFNPEHVIIGGGISEAGPFYITEIENKCQQYALPDCLRGVTFSAARLGNKAGFMGAAYFALQQSMH